MNTKPVDDFQLAGRVHHPPAGDQTSYIHSQSSSHQSGTFTRAEELQEEEGDLNKPWGKGNELLLPVQATRQCKYELDTIRDGTRTCLGAVGIILKS